MEHNLRVFPRENAYSPPHEVAFDLGRLLNMVSAARSTQVLIPHEVLRNLNRPAGDGEYKVVGGDTLSELAQRFNSTVAKFLGANPHVANPDLIYAGDLLKLPPGAVLQALVTAVAQDCQTQPEDAAAAKDQQRALDAQQAAANNPQALMTEKDVTSRVPSRLKSKGLAEQAGLDSEAASDVSGTQQADGDDAAAAQERLDAMRQKADGGESVDDAAGAAGAQQEAIQNRLDELQQLRGQQGKLDEYDPNAAAADVDAHAAVDPRVQAQDLNDALECGGLTQAQQAELFTRRLAALLGIQLPETKDSIVPISTDPAVQKAFGAQVLTQADVLDNLRALGLRTGETLNDPASREAIGKIQEAFGLPVTGDLDVDTLLAIVQARLNDDRRSQPARERGPAKLKDLAKEPQRLNSLTPEEAANYNYKAGDATPEQIAKIGGCSVDTARKVAPHLNRAMQEAGINTPARQAAFLAQMAHESAGFTATTEQASGRKYEGRRDLGNTQSGDGERFKGRGFVQLTGRFNYTAAGKALGLDLVGNPSLAARPENAARIAAWYWNSHGNNARADAGNFEGITKSINGGSNGRADRNHKYKVALAVLGPQEPVTRTA